MITIRQILSKEKNDLHKNEQYILLFILPIAMLLLSLTYGNPVNILKGIDRIRLSQDLLLTDYTVVGGTGAALANSAIITLANILLIRKLSLKPNGIIISSIFLITGFAFIGKNPFNIWPFYLGGYIYSKVHKIEYKNVVIVSILSTTLSPLISVLVSSLPYGFAISFLLASLMGCFLGYVMPAVSSQVLMAHSGYSLYNMGFAGGLMGIVIFSILKAIGIPMETNSIVGETMDLRFTLFMVGYFVFIALLGFFLNGRSFDGMLQLMRRSGRLVTDTTRLDGFPISLLNMGILGLSAMIYVSLMGGVYNGPCIAGILTVAGFGCFGKHLRNTIPILIGVWVAAMILNLDTSNSLIIIAGLFGTTLAPIIGEYGFGYGLIVGFLHLVVTLHISNLHGGIHLYNNGLSGGILATIIIPILDVFKKEKQNAI